MINHHPSVKANVTCESLVTIEPLTGKSATACTAFLDHVSPGTLVGGQGTFLWRMGHLGGSVG